VTSVLCSQRRFNPCENMIIFNLILIAPTRFALLSLNLIRMEMKEIAKFIKLWSPSDGLTGSNLVLHAKQELIIIRA
jgi:hypothetical protein